MNIVFSDLRENDYDIVKEIYDFYILNSTATFHTQLIPVTELKRQFQQVIQSIDPS